MEIVRFGPGRRRAAIAGVVPGPAEGVIWSDASGHVSELAFPRRSLIGPQTSPDQSLFVVVSGGGWVQVGEEAVAINHGEAVVWPPGVPHGAWTDGSEMRVILVELAAPALQVEPARIIVAEGTAGLGDVATPAIGALAQRQTRPEEHESLRGRAVVSPSRRAPRTGTQLPQHARRGAPDEPSRHRVGAVAQAPPIAHLLDHLDGRSRQERRDGDAQDVRDLVTHPRPVAVPPVPPRGRAPA